MAIQFVDDSDGGFSHSGFNPLSGGPYGFKRSFHYGGPGGSGANTAQWSITGLTAGVPVYVAVSYTNHTLYATAAPFSIVDSDGTTVLASTAVDQRNVPNSFYDRIDGTGGCCFKLLNGGATVTPTGTTLTIKVNDNSPGYVIADCVWVGTTLAGTFDFSVQNGDWDTTTTWNTGVVPTTSKVAIVRQVTVTTSGKTCGDGTNHRR